MASEAFSVTVHIGGSETTIKGSIQSESHRPDITEAQVKEKVGPAYQAALKATLNARKGVTPR